MLFADRGRKRGPRTRYASAAGEVRLLALSMWEARARSRGLTEESPDGVEEHEGYLGGGVGTVAVAIES